MQSKRGQAGHEEQGCSKGMFHILRNEFDLHSIDGPRDCPIK